MKIAKKATAAVMTAALAASMTCIAPALASAAPAEGAAAQVATTYDAMAAKTVKHTCKVGDKHALTFKVGKKKIKGSKVTWKSSNKKIASVSKKGVINAKKAGTVTITGKYKGTTVKYKVTVKAKANANKAATEFNDTIAQAKAMLKKYGTSHVESGQTIWTGSDKAAEGADKKLPVTFEYNEATKLFAVSTTLTTPDGAGVNKGSYTVKFVLSDNYADKDCTVISYKDGKQIMSATVKKSDLNLNNIPELASDGTDLLYSLIVMGAIQQAQENPTGIDALKKLGFTTIDAEYDQAQAEFDAAVATIKDEVMKIKPVVENGKTIYRLPTSGSGKYEGVTASYGYNATAGEFFVMINIDGADNGVFSVEFTYSDNYANKDCTFTSYRNGKLVKSETMKKSEFNESNIPLLSDDGQELMVYSLVLTGMANQIANNPVATSMLKSLGFSTIDNAKDENEKAFETMTNGLKKELKEAGAIVEGDQKIYGIVNEKKVDEGTLTLSQEYNETAGQFAASVAIDAPLTDGSGVASYAIRLTISDKYADKNCTIIASKDGKKVKELTMKKSDLKASALPALSDDAKDLMVFSLMGEAAAEQFKNNIVVTGIFMDLGFTNISK